MEQRVEDKVISDFVSNFLEEDPDYFRLKKMDKAITHNIYKVVVRAVMRVTQFDNVYPVILASDSPSANLLQEALNKVDGVLGNIENIKIKIVN